MLDLCHPVTKPILFPAGRKERHFHIFGTGGVMCLCLSLDVCDCEHIYTNVSTVGRRLRGNVTKEGMILTYYILTNVILDYVA